MRALPLTSSDPTVWGNTMEYVRKCPEKPTRRHGDALTVHIDANALGVASFEPTDRSPPGSFDPYARSGVSRHPPGDLRGGPSITGVFDKSAPNDGRSSHVQPVHYDRRLPPGGKGNRHPPGGYDSPTRHSHHYSRSRSPGRAHPPGAARGRLVALAMASPKKRARGTQGMPVDPEAYANLLADRVEADTAHFSLSTFEVGSKMKYRKKMTPAKALDGMVGLKSMSEEYLHIYHIYRNKLTSALSEASKRGKDYRQLRSVSEALNLDLSKASDGEIVSVLARLRALELVESPPS